MTHLLLYCGGEGDGKRKQIPNSTWEAFLKYFYISSVELFVIRSAQVYEQIRKL